MFYPLTDLKKGALGVISHLEGDAMHRCRLSELGFVPGAKVLLVAKMPCKGPFVFSLHGSQIALRHEQVKHIYIYPEAPLRGQS